MIPLLSVTTVNQIDSFERLIASIDYPIKTLSVLCNSYSFDYFLEIKKRCVSDFVEEFMLSHCPYNMGCSTSWNYHIKMNPECDYWFFSGDDIVFSEGDLENANESCKASDVAFSSLPAKYSFFALSKKCVNLVGFFDENIHPANFEDDDYDMRIRQHELLIATFDFGGNHIGGGTTNNLSEEDRKKLKKFYELNSNYYYAKMSSKNYSQGTFDFKERSKKLIRIQ